MNFKDGDVVTFNKIYNSLSLLPTRYRVVAHLLVLNGYELWYITAATPYQNYFRSFDELVAWGRGGWPTDELWKVKLVGNIYESMEVASF